MLRETRTKYNRSGCCQGQAVSVLHTFNSLGYPGQATCNWKPPGGFDRSPTGGWVLLHVPLGKCLCGTNGMHAIKPLKHKFSKRFLWVWPPRCVFQSNVRSLLAGDLHMSLYITSRKKCQTFKNLMCMNDSHP